MKLFVLLLGPPVTLEMQSFSQLKNFHISFTCFLCPLELSVQIA